jgi:hypothetical protein
MMGRAGARCPGEDARLTNGTIIDLGGIPVRALVFCCLWWCVCVCVFFSFRSGATRGVVDDDQTERGSW